MTELGTHAYKGVDFGITDDKVKPQYVIGGSIPC